MAVLDGTWLHGCRLEVHTDRRRPPATPGVTHLHEVGSVGSVGSAVGSLSLTAREGTQGGASVSAFAADDDGTASVAASDTSYFTERWLPPNLV